MAVLPSHLRSHGKGTLGKVGLILLTRKPVPTCARGFRVKTLKKTLKPSPWPGLHQQRIHREESRGEGLRTQWGSVMALSRCLSRAVVPGPNSISVSPRGCSSRSCRAARAAFPHPGALGCAVPHCSNKFYSILFYSIQFPHPPKEGMIQHQVIQNRF